MKFALYYGENFTFLTFLTLGRGLAGKAFHDSHTTHSILTVNREACVCALVSCRLQCPITSAAASNVFLVLPVTFSPRRRINGSILFYVSLLGNLCLSLFTLSPLIFYLSTLFAALQNVSPFSFLSHLSRGYLLPFFGIPNNFHSTQTLYSLLPPPLLFSPNS